jgi:hypothetical protein
MSFCQTASSKETSSGCIITDLALAMAPTGGAEIYAYLGSVSQYAIASDISWLSGL